MTQFYSDPRRANDPHALPDAEAFYVNAENIDKILGEANCEQTEYGDYSYGWYYWHCFPGCLPDSEPYGPFLTEQAAIDACREEVADGEG